MRQAALWRPFTERLFRAAGIGPGASVIDFGCGAGDTTFLAASIVGPTGRVLGVDRDPKQIAFCRARVTRTNFANVRFEQGDFDTLIGAGEWDAFVGRFVLMYQVDPSASLAAAARNLRPGGVCAFLEANVSDALVPYTTHARSAEFERALRLGTAALAKRIKPMMGVELPAALVAAGFDTSDCVFEGCAPVLRAENVRESAAHSSHMLARLAIADGTLPEAEFDPGAEVRWAESLPDDFACISGPLSVAGWGRKR